MNRILAIVRTLIIVIALLATSVQVLASTPEENTNPKIPSQAYKLDQSQEETNYGFWFEKTVIRWQEFKPTLPILSRIDLYINKNGDPGNLRTAVQDGEGEVLWETTVIDDVINESGWLELLVEPQVLLEPDSSYYIYVWAEEDSPNPDNRYFWRGKIESTYDRGMTSVESSLPGYDFGFRTWGRQTVSGICYIYNTDQSGAEDYGALLESNGFPTMLIPLSDVAATDFSGSRLIIIGTDTGNLSSWGDTASVSAIEDSGKPILALGEGGYSFLGQIGLETGYPHGWHGMDDTIYVVDKTHNIFTTPNQLSIPNNMLIPLYSNTNHVGINLPTVPSEVVALGRESDDNDHYPLTLEQNRYLLWGFTNFPSSMTETGKDLFINIITYLVPVITLTVDDNGSADFDDIQDAIDAATPGDTVLVYPGVYPGCLIMKDGVNLFGSGPAVTTIDGEGICDQVVTYSGNQATILSGFTITGSSSNAFWTTSGVLCSAGPLMIHNNVITENYVGICVGQGGTPTIINNTIVSNTASGITHGCPPTSQTILNNIIVSNGTGIWYYCDPESGEISYNDVWENNTNYFDNDKPGSFTPQPGTGEISEDPLFEDDDYHLSEGSPCIDAGHPGPEFSDPDGTRNDMGAYGGPGTETGNSGFDGSGFIFTSVGNIPVSEIVQDKDDPSHGLANVSQQIHEDFGIPRYQDSPFGHRLWLHGLFGDDDPVDYYRILIGEWDGDTVPTEFVPLKDTLTKVRYIINPDHTVSYEYVNLGPKTIDDTDGLYQLTREGYWTHIDLRLIWDTRNFENGKYQLTYEAYDLDEESGELTLLDLFENDQDHLTLVIDNSPVEAIIHNVKTDTGEEIPECGVISLTDPEDNLNFTITAWHPNGFLRAYTLEALYGKNKNAGIIASESYPTGSPPEWNGVQEEEFRSDESTQLDPWETCSYQFRLRAYSRATNGYHHIIRDTFNDHYYIYFPGDANGDSKTDGQDLIMVKKSMLQIEGATPASDANSDGEVNGRDLITIKKNILGIN
ncbi:MAG: NosD domain-containing protein [Chloroflexota bacterium]|nr:NosD domain-containing protein [Chloroflexota bacterium]